MSLEDLENQQTITEPKGDNIKQHDPMVQIHKDSNDTVNSMATSEDQDPVGGSSSPQSGDSSPRNESSQDVDISLSTAMTPIEEPEEECDSLSMLTPNAMAPSPVAM